jgi:hypothetical protein
MRNSLSLFIALLCYIPFGFAQNDPRDENYTPPTSLNLITAPASTVNGYLYTDFNMLLKFHPMELLRGQLSFSFEKAVGHSTSVELFAGHTRNISVFGAGSGFGSGIINEFVGEFSDNNQLPSDMLRLGNFTNAFRPTIGLGLKFFDDSELFDNALRTIQVFYRYSSAKLELAEGFDSEARIVRADSRLTSLASNEIGVRYGFQFIHFKKPRLSNEIGLSVSLNVVSYDEFQSLYYQTPQGSYFQEYVQTGSRDNTSYPSIRLYYSIGLGL